jgi:hypothetical protein
MPVCGSDNWRAKLTCEEVLDIYVLGHSKRYLQREIAQAFGVTQSAVSLIVHRRRWQWLLLNEEAMTDKTKDEEWQTKLAAAQATIAKLIAARREEARLRQSPTRQAHREMAEAVPTELVQDVAFDLRRGVSEPSSILPQPSQPQVKRGSGWVDPNPLTQPPGISLLDKLVDMQDAIDKRDLAQRLARGKE